MTPTLSKTQRAALVQAARHPLGRAMVKAPTRDALVRLGYLKVTPGEYLGVITDAGRHRAAHAVPGEHLVRCTILLSAAACNILSLDATANQRQVDCEPRGRHRNEVTGPGGRLLALAAELDDVAAGLLCDDTDNPSATRRAAKAAAEQIRKQLQALCPFCGEPRRRVIVRNATCGATECQEANHVRSSQ